MKISLFIVLIFIATTSGISQQDSIIIPESQLLDLESLEMEAMMNNPEIAATVHRMDAMEAKVTQARSLDDPEIQYMQDEMPGFRWNEAMYTRIGLMQSIRFPSKLSKQGTLAEIRAEHSHHDHQEKVNNVLATLRSEYYELWFVQQEFVLNRESIRLMKQFADIARTRFVNGQAPQQDVLKAQIELAMLTNKQSALRQKELSAKAMLMSILNRNSKDMLGFAVIPEEVIFTASIDSLEQLALQVRPMLRHDSLGIAESQSELSLAKMEYLPDFFVGIDRVTSPSDGFSGWSVRAGITLPFAPWVLGKAGSRTEEAEATIEQSKASFEASKNMVLSSVRDAYYKARSAKEQLDMFRLVILPQSQQALNGSLTGYQTGGVNFLMLIDSYKTYVDLTREYFMTRMQFEQTLAQLDREVGYQSASVMK